MRRCVLSLLLTLFAVFCIFSSCVFDDAADSFVGTYKVSVLENIRWGNDSGTTTPTGTFMISKVSASRVKVSGFIDTYGEVNGQTIFLESIFDSDTEGSLTTVFQPGFLNGNVLTFSSTSTGQLKYNGRMYPYSSSGSWTAIRQ